MKKYDFLFKEIDKAKTNDERIEKLKEKIINWRFLEATTENTDYAIELGFEEGVLLGRLWREIKNKFSSMTEEEQTNIYDKIKEKIYEEARIKISEHHEEYYKRMQNDKN